MVAVVAAVAAAALADSYVHTHSRLFSITHTPRSEFFSHMLTHVDHASQHSTHGHTCFTHACTATQQFRDGHGRRARRHVGIRVRDTEAGLTGPRLFGRRKY